VSSLQNLVNDEVPDFYAFTFSAITSLIESYGREGAEVVGALHLTDALLPKFIHDYQALYPKRALVSVLLLGAHSSEWMSVDKREAFAEISQLLPSQSHLADYYPNIYVDTDRARLVEACQVLSLKLDTIGYSVYCPSSPLQPVISVSSSNNRFRSSRHLFSSNGTNASCGNSTVPCEDLYRYQIVLWTAIGGAFILFWTIYTIGWMAFKKDTLLYSTFNPNWEDRKRH